MKKTMIYIPDNIHEGLRKIAFEQKTTMAELIRKAIEKTYEEDLQDISDMEHELALYAADRNSAKELNEYLAQRKTSASS